MGGRGSNEKRRNRCTGEQGEQEEQENRGNSYLYTSNDNNIFFGGGGSWKFWRGSFYTSNTLDRTLGKR